MAVETVFTCRLVAAARPSRAFLDCFALAALRHHSSKPKSQVTSFTPTTAFTEHRSGNDIYSMDNPVDCIDLYQTQKISELSHRYEICQRDTERIYEEERARVLRVQLLLLEDENSELQDRLDEDNSAIEKLEDNNYEMRTRLSEVEAELGQVQAELKTRLREIERLKTEIEAQNNANSEATKILSEKLALSREVATLKPELEHLRSQTSSQQSVLAEKLALLRELSSVQVELENEKKTVQRLQNQKQTASHDDSALYGEIDDLKKEVSKLQKEVQKSQRESIKKHSDLESQKDVLESKLDAFRTKLRTTKEQLKEAQDELEKSQAAKMAQSAELTKARLAGRMAPPPSIGPANPRKRGVARFDPDMTIGTPGQGVAAKKQRVSVSIGDKSTFSMTPFLIRTTMSILPETPSEEVAEDQDRDETEASPEEEMRKQMDSIIEEAEAEAAQKKAAKEARDKMRPVAKTTTKAKPAAEAKKSTQPLKESTASKANKVVQKPALEKVVEEEDSAEQPTKFVLDPVPKSEKQLTTTNASDEENNNPDDKPAKPQRDLKRKRPNIFDEDDDALPAEPAKSKKIKTLKSLSKPSGSGAALSGVVGNISLLGAGTNLGAGGAKARKTFAEFSPLKKNRPAASVAK